MFAERQGLHLRLLRPLRGMYRELRRRFVMAGPREEGICCLYRRHSRLSSESASAKPLHEHLGQINESRDHNSNAQKCMRRHHISRRIRSALLPLQTKASLIACLVGPAAMYGFSAGGFKTWHRNSAEFGDRGTLWPIFARRCRLAARVMERRRRLDNTLCILSSTQWASWNCEVQ